MAYSKDYRQMILDKLDQCYNFRELSEEYGHSTSILQKLEKDIDRKPITGRPRTIDDDFLHKDVEMYLDAYQYERAYRFNCADRDISKALNDTALLKRQFYCD